MEAIVKVVEFLVSVCVISFLFVTPCFAWDTFVSKNKTVKYKILALDGTWHDIEFFYSALLQFNEYQTGHSAKIKFSGTSLRDTRQCHLDSRRSLSKKFNGSRSQKTGEQDILYGPIKSVFADASSSNSEIADKFFQTLFYGGLYDFGDTAFELGDDVYQSLDALFETKNPFEFSQDVLNAALDLNLNTLDLLGNSIGRTLGFRTGTNCGEARPLNVANRGYQKTAFRAKLELTFALDPYQSIPDIVRSWKYKSPDGRWVPAIFILPESIEVGSDLILASQYLVLIDLISRGKIPPGMLEDILDMPVGTQGPRLVTVKLLKVEADKLAKHAEGLVAKSEGIARELNTLIFFNNPLSGGKNSWGNEKLPVQDEVDFVIASSGQKTLPACLVMPGASQGHYLLSIGRTAADVQKIRQLSDSLSEVTTPVVSEIERLLEFRGLAGVSQEQVFNSIEELQKKLVPILAPVASIAKYDRKKRECENKVRAFHILPFSEIVPPSWLDKLEIVGEGPIVRPENQIDTNILLHLGSEKFEDLEFFEVSKGLSSVLMKN
jgi:hypothetical protein